MNTKSTNQPGRPVLQRAAETGLYLGGYLSLLALATGLSQSAPAASLLVWAGSIALPFALYVLLRRSLAERDFSATFSEVWLEGIASFFFGSMIQAVIIYLGLRFLAPHTKSIAVVADAQQYGIAFGMGAVVVLLFYRKHFREAVRCGCNVVGRNCIALTE